jgi:DNA (cytosine-5)-methyltransferase 1
MNKIRFVDLFAGIGGFRQAVIHSNIENVEFEPVGACEIDKTCKLVYQQVFDTKEEVFIDDVQKIYTKDNLNQEEQIKLPPFDLLFGGFPCQPFSNVGYRKGLDDPRGALFFEIVRILRFYKPKFFILENVSKIASVSQGEVMSILIKELEDAGYHVHLWDLYANNYGLPQKRRRAFFCGVSKEYNSKKIIQEPEQIPRDQWQYPTTWHLLEKTMDPKHIIPKKTRETALRKNPKWQGDLQIDRDIARPITASMAKWHRANQDNYFSATYVDINNPDPYTSPEVDWDSEPIRRITPLEGLRLQGFSDFYAKVFEENKISFTASYRMIGNAVPVNLAKSVTDHFLSNYLK